MAFPNSHPFLFQTNLEDHHHHHLPPNLNNSILSLPPHHFHQGGGVGLMMKRSMSFSGIENKHCDAMHGDDELSDDGSHLGEKKKRLNMEQVKALEKSFEIGNKVEPERKMQLAKALGLQQRQVAIWFQNRRARWKTKQLEKEYEVLKKQFEALKVDNDNLKDQNQKLHGQLQALKSNKDCFESGAIISLKKETDQGSWSNNGSDISSNMNLDLSTKQVMNTTHMHVSSQNGKSITQLLQCSSRLDLQEENFTNMFHNIEDQHNFWPWSEQNHFN